MKELEEYLRSIKHPDKLNYQNRDKIAQSFNVTVDVVTQMIKKLKNSTEIEHFSDYLQSNGLNLKDVKKVKFWQSPSGEQRYSVDTNDNFHNTKFDINEYVSTFKDFFTDSVNPVNIECSNKSNYSLFIYTSDKHIGAVGDHTEILNSYNSDVFKNRLYSVLQIAYDSYVKFGKFDKIYILDLGDALDGMDGYTVRRDHRLPQNMSNEECLNIYFNVHKDLFDNLVEMGITNSIEWRAISNSNHDGSFGYAAHRLLEVYLNAKYPQIVTNIQTKFMDHFYYGEHCFITTHGKDKSEMKKGFPLNLNDSTQVFINDYIHHHKINAGNIHVIKGDLHQSSEEYGKYFRYKNVRSLFGGSKWIHTNYGSCKAGIDYEIVHKTTDSIFSSKVTFNP